MKILKEVQRSGFRTLPIQVRKRYRLGFLISEVGFFKNFFRELAIRKKIAFRVRPKLSGPGHTVAPTQLAFFKERRPLGFSIGSCEIWVLRGVSELS